MPTLSRVAYTGDNAGSFTHSFSATMGGVISSSASDVQIIPIHFIQPYVAGVLPGWSIESPALKGTSEYGIVRKVTFTTQTTISGTGAAGAGATLAIKRYRAAAATNTIASLAFNTGVDATALTPVTITLSTTLADIKVLFGDLLVAVWTQGGTGLATTANALVTVDLL